MLGIDHLAAVAKELCGRNASQALLGVFPMDAEGISAFSAGVMAFIPRKAPQEQEGREFHAPGVARPLTQRGFLPGRSLLSNALDIDVDVRFASAGRVSPGAVFFYFAAAFSSIAHEFMTAVLEHVGIHQEVRHLAAAVLYLGHGCKPAAASEHLQGFAIRAGIRQGCPLFPLLFAMCGDFLLRKLSAALPADVLRAYADDLGLVFQGHVGLGGHVRPHLRRVCLALWLGPELA